MKTTDNTSECAETTLRQKGKTTATWATLVIVVLVSVLFTSLIVQYSLKYGRLLYPPTYEDSRYVTDGLSRLFELYDHGALAAAKSYVANPPVSPFSSYLAMAGFAVFGTYDWAPYACNCILIVILLLYLVHRVGGSRRWPKTVVAVFAFLTPLTALAVHEYRPDLACGLATAVGMIELTGTALTAISRKRSIVIGCWFGLALFAKPSVFPGTLVFLAAALVLSAARAWIEGDLRHSFTLAARRGAAIVAVAAAVSGLYFVVGLKYQAMYLYQNALTETRHQWALQGSLMDHLRYYLDGPGGKQVFGSFVPLYVFLLVSAVLWAVLCRDRKGRIEIGCALGALFAGYIVPTILPAKALFGDAAFAWMVVIYSCLWLGAMLSVPGPWRGIRLVAAGVAGITVLFAGVRFQLPSKWGDYGSPYTQKANQAMSEITRFVVQRASAGKTKVFLTTIGFHTDLALTYLVLKEHFDPRKLTISQIPFATKLDAYAKEIDKADVVVATETGADFLAYALPCNKMQDEVLNTLKANTDFTEVKSIPTASGKSYYLFERVRMPGVPAIISVQPAAGSGRKQVFRIEVGDTGGARAIQGVMFRVAPEQKDAPVCVVHYNAPHGAIGVAVGQGVWSSEAIPGRKGTIGSSQCSVDVGASSVETAGKSVVLRLALRFEPVFAGTKSVMVFGTNSLQRDSGWVTVGKWTVP